MPHTTVPPTAQYGPFPPSPQVRAAWDRIAQLGRRARITEYEATQARLRANAARWDADRARRLARIAAYEAECARRTVN